MLPVHVFRNVPVVRGSDRQKDHFRQRTVLPVHVFRNVLIVRGGLIVKRIIFVRVTIRSAVTVCL